MRIFKTFIRAFRLRRRAIRGFIVLRGSKAWKKIKAAKQRFAPLLSLAHKSSQAGEFTNRKKSIIMSL